MRYCWLPRLPFSAPRSITGGATVLGGRRYQADAQVRAARCRERGQREEAPAVRQPDDRRRRDGGVLAGAEVADEQLDIPGLLYRVDLAGARHYPLVHDPVTDGGQREVAADRAGHDHVSGGAPGAGGAGTRAATITHSAPEIANHPVVSAIERRKSLVITPPVTRTPAASLAATTERQPVACPGSGVGR